MEAISDHDLLVRLDERTASIQLSIGTFVTKKEFQPVKAIVYGLVGLILTGVFTSLLALVITRAQ